MWRFACGMLAGCVLLLWLPRLPSGGMLLGGAVLACLLLSSPLARPLGAVVLGFAYCGWIAGDRLDDRLEPELEGRTLALHGQVASVPQEVAEGLRFRFAPEPAPGVPRLLELTWYEPEWRPLAAERLAVEVRLRRPRGFANPGGVDNSARMLREGIGASGYVRSAERLGRNRADALRAPVLVVRAVVADAIRESLGRRPATGIVAGLSVGLQDALSREQWLALSRSGTSHLMAISGLHIAMVGAIVAWVAGRVQRWRQARGACGCRRDVAVAAGAIAAAVYAVLAGWSVPTQRTLLMIVIAAATLRLRRRIGIAHGLGLCLAAVLVLHPLAPLAPGFWLSFGAVAAILAATAGYIEPDGPARAYLRVQLAVTVGLAPVLVGSFGGVSLVSVVVNLLAIPLYTLLVVPAALLASALAVTWHGAGQVALQGVAWLIETTWPLIEVPAGWHYATFAVAGPSPLAWLALLAGTAALLAPLPRPGRIAGAVLVGAGCLWRPAPPDVGAVRLTVLDVGQGLAAVVRTRRHVLVYDTGPAFRSGGDAGQVAVLPFLRVRGMRALDMLAVSHADDDHAGGAASIAAALPARVLVTSPDMRRPHWAAAASLAVRPCRRGERWQWDGVEFEWLHPGAELHERDNDGSCVLRVRTGARSALLAGDVELAAESEMLAAGVLGPVDVLVAPHHGSRSSSSVAFVEATRPAWVVFAAGHHNRWGFPSPPVEERWRAHGARTVTTASSGAVEFLLRPGQPVEPPRRWRVDHRRSWTDP